MGASRFDFVNQVVRVRDLRITSDQEHSCGMEPRSADLLWHCDLDDGTPTDPEKDPASYVRFVCPALKLDRVRPDPPLEVRRAGPQSDLGKLVQGVGRLFGRGPRRTPAVTTEERYVYTDRAGILDDDMRHRLENWPRAMHGDGVVRPAELWSIRVTYEGLIVESSSWWDSAAALDHQLTLAIDLADRLAARR